MALAKYKQIIKSLRDCHAAYEELSRCLNSGPASFHFERLEQIVDGLQSFARFKEGDEVFLTEDIDCSNAPGWQGCQHFLKRGARAHISEISFGNKGFSYGIEFVNETYLYDGVAKPVSAKHQFWFNEKQLGKIS